jgi:CHAT domain-containing protein
LKVNRGDLSSALVESEAGLKQFPSPDSEWHWRFTILKAEIKMRQRSNKESLALLEPELPASLKGTDLAVWQKLIQGTANSRLLQFDQAKTFLDEAEFLAKTNSPALLGEVALRRGTLAFLRGDPKTAESEYRKALTDSLLRKDSFLEASALGSLGLAATRQEHFDESIDWDNAALRLSNSLGARISAARILGNLGWSYFELGDYENSLALFRQAEESFAQAGAPGLQIEWLTDIGVTEYYLGNYEGAEKESLKALELARSHGDQLAITECLNNLSLVALSQGHIELAGTYNFEAVKTALAAKDADGGVTALLGSGRIEEARKHFKEAEQALKTVLENPSAATALRWEAEARLGTLYDEEGRTAAAEKEYKRAIQTIQAARLSVGQDELRLTFLSSAIDFYDDYIDFLVRHGRAEDALQVADLTRSQTLAEGLASANHAPAERHLKPLPRQLAQKLRATLLVYWVGQNHSYLWAITPTKLTYFLLPKKSQIDPAVKAYRQAILDGHDVLASDSEDGKQLFAILVAPARNLIPKDSRVVLLPAESLFGLNFETIIVPDPHPHFWIEDVTLSTASSLALLSSSNHKPFGSENSLLLVGNPEPASADFPALAQGRAEIQKISSHFPSAKREVLEGRKATAAAYLTSSPGRFSYLHFVTHGTASQTRPLESAVILSRDGDSFKLYARDIVTHPLHAQLVTISACNGAGSRAYAGEGLVGLSWAFLRAGAHNVIASLWEVSDASSTPQLMDTLYEGLTHGEDPAIALRNAKLSLLKSNAHSVFAKPFYWAPFQLYAGS